MQPEATFVNCACTVKITHLCERLGIPLLSFRHVRSVNHPTTAVVPQEGRRPMLLIGNHPASYVRMLIATPQLLFRRIRTVGKSACDLRHARLCVPLSVRHYHRGSQYPNLLET